MEKSMEERGMTWCKPLQNFHFDPGALFRFLNSLVPDDDEQEAVFRHILSCETCRTLYVADVPLIEGILKTWEENGWTVGSSQKNSIDGGR